MPIKIHRAVVLKMKNYIKQCLIKMHLECTTDQYGQVNKSNFTPKIFGEKKDAVIKYCRKNKGILKFSTYASGYGWTYMAFTIQDNEIAKECRLALMKNPNHIRNSSRYPY